MINITHKPFWFKGLGTLAVGRAVGVMPAPPGRCAARGFLLPRGQDISADFIPAT